MKRALKILFVVFVVFVGLCVAGVAVLLTLDLNEYKDTIAEKAKEATGRDLTISGNIGVAWSMAPTLRVEGISFANADWGSRKEMLKLDAFEAQVELMPLLSRQIRIPRVMVKGLDVLAETNAEGKGNWEMVGMQPKKAEPTEADEDGAPTIPIIEQVIVENVKVAFKDGQTGRTINAVLESLQAMSEDPTKPVIISLKGAVNGAAVAVAGSLGAPAALMANDPYALSLKAKALDVVAAIEGSIGRPMEAKGIDVAVSADIADLAKTLKAASVIVPDLAKRAEGMAPMTISFAGQAADTDDGYALKGMRLAIGESDLTGDAAVAFAGDRPKATASMASTKLDLNALAALQGGGEPSDKTMASPPGDGKVFSADPLPLDALKAADADLDVTAAQIILPGGAAIKGLAVKIVLTDGKLVVEPMSMTVGGGSLGGTVTLDGSAGAADLNVAVTGAGIVLGDILQEMNLKDSLQGGATDLSITLKGKGASVRELMAGLNGSVVVETGEGKLNNKTIDVVGGDVVTGVFGALNPFGESKEYSVLTCAAVKVTIEDGIAKIDKGIAVETEQTNVVGSGGIDLKQEKLDIGIKPEASGGVGLSLGGAASMVRLTGSLAEPGISLDALETAKTAASTAAAIMTFGLSKGAEALINTATRDPHPCATALGKAPPEEEPATPTATGTTAEDPKKEAPKSGIGGAVEGVGKLFGFGK